jgi:hypothetical protein
LWKQECELQKDRTHFKLPEHWQNEESHDDVEEAGNFYSSASSDFASLSLN